MIPGGDGTITFAGVNTWRRYLPTRKDGALARKKDVESFFDAAPPQTVELLETETYRVVPWLMARAKVIANRSRTLNEDGEADGITHPRLSDVVVISLTPAGDVSAQLRLADLLEEDELDVALRGAGLEERALVARRSGSNSKREKVKDVIELHASNATLVIDRRLGGLDSTGLLDDEVDDIPKTADDETQSLCLFDNGEPTIRFRVRSTDDAMGPDQTYWRPRSQFAVQESEDGLGRYLIVEKWRYDGVNEEDRSAAGRPQLLDEHESWAEERARALAAALGLDDYSDTLAVTARVHDHGKRAPRWQYDLAIRPRHVHAAAKLIYAGRNAANGVRTFIIRFALGQLPSINENITHVEEPRLHHH